jgi:hypothetical protein
MNLKLFDVKPISLLDQRNIGEKGSVFVGICKVYSFKVEIFFLYNTH